MGRAAGYFEMSSLSNRIGRNVVLEQLDRSKYRHRAAGQVEMSPKGRQKAWNVGISWPKIDEPPPERTEIVKPDHKFILIYIYIYIYIYKEMLERLKN